MSAEWERVCVLCAARNRKTRLEAGHCCIPCAGWLQTAIADILRLAADAAAWVAPGSSTGGGSRPVPSSRPPVDVAALDPENTTVPGYGATVLELCEAWTRMVRESRQMAPYGPWVALEAAKAAGRQNDTGLTLVAVTGFLGRSVPWMIDAVDFPLEDFADEIRACVRALRRFDLAAEDRGQMVKCPTLHDDEGECGYRLYYRDLATDVTCRRCGVTRKGETLLAISVTDSQREIWVDPEAAARHSGVDVRTLRMWAKRGHIDVRRGMYDLTSISKAIEGASA